MIATLIFDLSEVLIAGLVGIETELAERVDADPKEVLAAFGGRQLDELLHGRCREEEYLREVLAVHGWQLEPAELHALVRKNFERRVAGMEELLADLPAEIELVLLSDHGDEWVEHIRSIHPFLERFDRQYFSCHIGATKRSERAFEHVLEETGREPGECLFIDDNVDNVEVARSLGMNAVHFTGADELRSELRGYGLTV